MGSYLNEVDAISKFITPSPDSEDHLSHLAWDKHPWM
jgi:hypothetical protein